MKSLRTPLPRHLAEESLKSPMHWAQDEGPKTPLLWKSPAPTKRDNVENASPGWTPWWEDNKGWILVIVAELFGALMNAIARLLEDNDADTSMHPLQIIFARMSITFVLSSAYMWYAHVPDFPLGAKDIRWLLVLRGFGGFVGVFGIYYALVYLPIADVTVIGFLVPPVTLWAGSIFLGERFTRREVLAVIASFAGVIIIARPLALLQPVEFMCGDLHNEHHPNQISKPMERLWAIMLAMIGVLGGATAYTVIRHVGKRVHPLISVNYYAFIAAVVSLIALLGVPNIQFQLPATPREWLLLLSMGVSGFMLALGLTAGLQQGKGNVATLMMYMEIIFSLALDKIIWNNTPDGFSIVGGLIVLASSIFAAIRKDPVQKLGEGTDEEQQLVAGDEKLEDDSDDDFEDD